MRTVYKSLRFFFLFTVLTVLTQIGGVVYVVYQLLANFLVKNQRSGWRLSLQKLAIFSSIYLLATFALVPMLAKIGGRVPLPHRATKQFPLAAHTKLTILLNRHYVRPELKESIRRISIKYREHYPEFPLVYLDANFPFLDGFPLLPHRSHDDGKKLDIAFTYRKMPDQKLVKKLPILTGYGRFEMPQKGEFNQAASCQKGGHWQYSILGKFVSSRPKNKYLFDAKRNKKLCQIIANDPAIRKIFIEPHLVKRLKLTSKKFRFHGCKAVRHDDHIHLQL
ncbi:MAG: hypothetical protein AAFV95_11945 [Bacteroidota bacterium]